MSQADWRRAGLDSDKDVDQDSLSMKPSVSAELVDVRNDAVSSLEAGRSDRSAADKLRTISRLRSLDHAASREDASYGPTNPLENERREGSSRWRAWKLGAWYLSSAIPGLGMFGEVRLSERDIPAQVS